MAALTATATIKMHQDVFCTLDMKTPQIITGVVDTPNINTLWGRGEGERERERESGRVGGGGGGRKRETERARERERARELFSKTVPMQCIMHTQSVTVLTEGWSLSLSSGFHCNITNNDHNSGFHCNIPNHHHNSGFHCNITNNDHN